MKRFIFLTLAVIALVGLSWGQTAVELTEKNITLKRLSTGEDYSTKVAIPPSKRDTTKTFYVGSTGGTMHIQCSLKVNSGGEFSMGDLRGRTDVSAKMLYGDSVRYVNSRTTAGYYEFTYDLPYASWMQFTFSNRGSDTVWLKIEPGSKIGVGSWDPALVAGPVLMKDLNGADISAKYVATAGNCTTLWYRAKGKSKATLWDAAVDTSTFGTTDSLDFTWVAQGNWQNGGSPFWPDSGGASTGVPTATTERVGHMFNTALPEVDTCYVQYPPFDCDGWEWIRFIGKSTTATNPQACKHWVYILFQSKNEQSGSK
jgi:hypothetical protein